MRSFVLLLLLFLSMGSLAQEYNYTISPKCQQDLDLVEASSKRGNTWAMGMLDASFVKESGFLAGNVLWFGDFDECLLLGPTKINDQPIEAHYCLYLLTGAPESYTYAQPSIYPVAGFHVGQCIPKSCNLEDGGYMIRQNPLISKIAKMRPELVNSQCFNTELPWRDYEIVALVVFTAIGTILVLALLYDIFGRFKRWLAARKSSRLPTVQANVGNEQVTIEETVKVVNEKPTRQPGKIEQLILGFSPYANFEKLFQLSTSQPKGPNLNCINGIRTFSLLWIMLGHAYIFYIPITDNPTQTQKKIEQPSMTFVLSGYNAVDTFLYLSGFLAYWSLAKQMKIENGIKSFFQIPILYFHRYVRLTVPYGLLIFFSVGIWPHLAAGPFWLQKPDAYCVDNWWTNLLYINNFLDYNRMCLGHSWYLAVDFQLFLIAPIVVLLFNWRPIAGWISSFVIIGVQIFLGFYLTFEYNLPSSQSSPITNANATAAKNYSEYYGIYYIKPYTRIGPYIVGIIAAYLIMQHGDFIRKRIMSNPIIMVVNWTVALALFLVLTYGQFGIYAGLYIDPVFWDALYNAIARMIWGVALSWLIWCCVFNSGGVIGDFLGWPGWAITARLSYAAYLLHPFVYLFFLGTSRRSTHINDYSIAYHYAAAVALTLGVSVPFTLALESPVIGVQRMLIPGKGKRE